MWTLKEDHKRKLRVFEMSVLRTIYRITKTDRSRNVDIMQELSIEKTFLPCFKFKD